MSKTSLKDYIIAGLTGSFIVTMIVIAVFSVPSFFNIEGFENTSFSSFDNLTEYAELVNESSDETYQTTADSSAFDVVGSLIVKGLDAVKTIFGGINFLQNSVDTMLNSLGLGISLGQVVTYIISVIGISLVVVFLLRIIIKTEDEKP